MASELRSLKFPPVLADIADLRAKQENYPSWAGYVKGLVLFDGFCPAKHSVTVPISKEPLGVQDKIHAIVLKRLLKEKGFTSVQLKKMSVADLLGLDE